MNPSDVGVVRRQEPLYHHGLFDFITGACLFTALRQHHTSALFFLHLFVFNLSFSSQDTKLNSYELDIGEQRIYVTGSVRLPEIVRWIQFACFSFYLQFWLSVKKRSWRLEDHWTILENNLLIQTPVLSLVVIAFLLAQRDPLLS